MKLASVLAVLTASLLALSVGAQNGPWGTVTGSIVWDKKAKVPVRMPLDLKGNTDQGYCEKDGKVQIETWVVDPKSGGLKNTFVWLANEDVKNKKFTAIHPTLKGLPDQKVVEIDQPLCAFTPHALALREGQDLLVKNGAKIPHNFKYTGNPFNDNAGGNFLMPPGTQKAVKLVADRLPVQAECNIHPWMKAWIRVFDHPYYAVTGTDGKFEFKNAPAGKYRLIVWHGSGGWLGGAKGKDGQVIEIKADGTTDLGAIEYPEPAQ